MTEKKKCVVVDGKGLYEGKISQCTVWFFKDPFFVFCLCFWFFVCFVVGVLVGWVFFCGFFFKGNCCRLCEMWLAALFTSKVITS